MYGISMRILLDIYLPNKRLNVKITRILYALIHILAVEVMVGPAGIEPTTNRL